MQKNLVCDDCNFMFRVYAPMRKKGVRPGTQFFCPNCGDNVSVRDYINPRVSDPEKHKKIKWQPEELTELKRCLAKGIPAHQIMLRLGRSKNSVENKIRQVRAAKKSD